MPLFQQQIPYSKTFLDNCFYLSTDFQNFAANFLDILTSCSRVVLHPCARQHFLALVTDMESLVGYARKYVHAFVRWSKLLKLVLINDTVYDPKFSDRQVWANSVDPDQPERAVSGSTLFAILSAFLYTLQYGKPLMFKF